MTPKQTARWAIGLSAVLLFIFCVVALAGVEANQAKDSTAVLAIITATAIGIERVLEVVWTLVGTARGSWWPLNLVSTQINELVSSLDATVQPFYQKAHTAMLQVAAAENWTNRQIQAAEKELVEFKQRLDSLKGLAPDSQRIQSLTTAATQSVGYLQLKYPALSTDAEIAGQAVAGVTNLIATFKDNPGRRLISIYVGSCLGMIVSGLVGLDIFQAVLGTPGVSESSLLAGIWRLFPHLGVALTGVVMGLGSSPTHEVIRALQEVKQSRKAENV